MFKYGGLHLEHILLHSTKIYCKIVVVLNKYLVSVVHTTVKKVYTWTNISLTVGVDKFVKFAEICNVIATSSITH